MMTLDRAVLVREAGVVASSGHAVMLAQRFIAPGLIGAGVVVEVAKRRREAVRAMLPRRTAQRPQGVL